MFFFAFIVLEFILGCLLLQDIGAAKGKYYAVNFPLRDGIDDDSYEKIFNPVSGRTWPLELLFMVTLLSLFGSCKF